MIDIASIIDSALEDEDIVTPLVRALTKGHTPSREASDRTRDEYFARYGNQWRPTNTVIYAGGKKFIGEAAARWLERPTLKTWTRDSWHDWNKGFMARLGAY